MRLGSVSSIVVAAIAVSTIVLAAQNSGRRKDAAAVRNPVRADASSVAAGSKLYQSNCSPCHGEAARGDGKMASQFDPKPSDLTDAEWKHGSSDGEVFAVIRDGVKDTGMKGFGSKMTARQIWDVINYLRSIGPR